MKKILLLLVLFLLLVGCSNTKVVERKEDSETKENKTPGIADNSNNSQETKEETTTNINFNETVSIGDMCEITFENAEWVDSLLPSNTLGVYSYYEDEEGETYCVIHGKLTNLATEDLDVQWITEAKVIVNDKYKYDATFVLESNDGSDFYGNAKPLQTLNLVVYSSITDEAKNMVENLKLEFSMLSNSENVRNFYSEDMPHENYSLNIQ